MTMKPLKFNNEEELENWVESNISSFFDKDVIYLKGQHYIYTKRDKGAKPDGFVLDLKNSSWTIIENELIKHGVWNHIAEQIMRFIVASKSDRTQKKIRNMFLDEIEKRKLIPKFSKSLEVPEARIFQTIENIIEGQSPEMAIFIDEVNDDLKDMCDALNATVQVFKIQKFEVGGKIEIFSPDNNQPALETTIEDVKDATVKHSVAIDLLGGGKILDKSGGVKIYKLDKDNTLVSTKYSKKYGDSGYWFGITPNTVQKYIDSDISYMVFILEQEGIVKLPRKILEEYLSTALTTPKPDGSIKHYHVYLKMEKDEVILYTSKNKKIYKVSEYYLPAQ